MIQAVVSGNVGQGAQTKPNGTTTVTEFSVASNRKDRDGNEQTTWVRCSLWGRRGEQVAPFLTKGRQVTVVGELAARAFTAQDGTARVGLDLRVGNLALQGGGQQAQQAPAYAPMQAAPQYAPAPAARQAPAPAYAPQRAPQGYAQPAPQQYQPATVPQAAADDENIPF